MPSRSFSRSSGRVGRPTATSPENSPHGEDCGLGFFVTCQNGRVGPPQRCLSPRDARHWQAARPAPLSSAVQPCHPTRACDRSPHAGLATAHNQPAAMHTAISSHTPPGQGDPGRETVVGSTPSIPMMAATVSTALRTSSSRRHFLRRTSVVTPRHSSAMSPLGTA